MKLDRSEFLKAVKFLSPAIMKGSRTEIMSHLHVKIENGGERCILTATNGVVGKRVNLIRPSQLTIDEKQNHEKDQEFLIDKASFEGFEAICIRHKAMYSKSKDQSIKEIFIGAEELWSLGKKLKYDQPVFQVDQFPDIEQNFYAHQEAATTMIFNAKNALIAFNGFGANCEVTFSGETGAVYIQEGDRDFQAFFMPAELEDIEEDED